MTCSVNMMSYNFVIHATCPLAFTTYKYNELQMFSATQKLSCKANCKTPLFHSIRYLGTNWLEGFCGGGKLVEF
jgi:hypothetical protein